MYETKVALNGDNLRLSMPLMKVDEEHRTVHGFATLNNLDKQDDIVTQQASVKAFQEFRGNIREQHDPNKAVGRVVSFVLDSYFDTTTNKVYDGVFVSAYVSKGAEDTWQKVLDKTLSGFSIGAIVKDYDLAYDEGIEKMIRIVTDYELYELSLVDAPANQFANIVSVEKSDSGMTVHTPLVKGDIENIFWCRQDSVVSMAPSEKSSCSICSCNMENIGFIERNEPDKNKVVKSLLDEYKKRTAIDQSIVEQTEKEASKKVAEDTTEEVIEVTKSEEVEAEADVDVIEKADEEEVAQEEVVEKSVEAPEAEAEAEVVEVVKNDAADQVAELSSTLVASLTALTDTVKTLNDRIEQIAKSVQGVEGEVANVKSNVNEFEKRVDAVEDTTAFRKSGDLGEVAQEQVVQKTVSPWGGRFLTTTDL